MKRVKKKKNSQKLTEIEKSKSKKVDKGKKKAKKELEVLGESKQSQGNN